MDAQAAAAWLRDATAQMEAPGNVSHIYRPLDYAWEAHAAYCERYGQGPKRAILVGMNPGPWGMGQTGIPFGEVSLVGDWLGLRGAAIHPPAPKEQHAKRPIEGWACGRSEASGRRLWGLLRARNEVASTALANLFVANHCPLLFFGPGGKNLTPDHLPREATDQLYQICNEGLTRLCDALRPEVLIGVGAYAEARCKEVVNEIAGATILVDRIPHPSPASPFANRDGGRPWRAAVSSVLDRHAL